MSLEKAISQETLAWRRRRDALQAHIDTLDRFYERALRMQVVDSTITNTLFQERYALIREQHRAYNDWDRKTQLLLWGEENRWAILD